MYFLELLVKYFKKDKVETLIDKLESERATDPLNNEFGVEDESEACEHIFMPLDSTGENFACTKCGLVIDRKAYERLL